MESLSPSTLDCDDFEYQGVEVDLDRSELCSGQHEGSEHTGFLKGLDCVSVYAQNIPCSKNAYLIRHPPSLSILGLDLLNRQDLPVF